MRALRLSAVLLTALALITTAPPASAVGTVTGRVWQPGGLSGATGASVTLYRIGETSAAYATTAGSGGAYTFSSIADGSYHLRALSTTYGVEYYNDSVIRTGAAAIVVTGGSSANIDVEFNDSGDITGVIDEEGGGSGGLAGSGSAFLPGSPVVGEVEMNAEAAFLHQRGETYADYFRQALASRSPFVLDPTQLIAPEYQSVRNIDQPSNLWALSSMPLPGSPALQFVGGATVEGKNIDTGVTYTTTADVNNGSYSLKNLPPGRYKVNAYAPGWVREWYDDYYSESAALAVVMNGNSQVIDLTFALNKAGSVTGTVYDSNGVTPLNNRRVMWVSPNYTSLVRCTDASGHYTLPDAPTNAAFTVFVDGDLDCASSPSTYGDQYWQDRQASRNATPLAFSPGVTSFSNIDFTLHAGGRISGTVFQPGGVTPISGASVFFYETDHTLVATTSTNGSGVYTSPYLSPGSYYVYLPQTSGYAQQYYVSVPDFATAAQISVSAGATTANVNFTRITLAGGGTGSLSGTVYLPGAIQTLANATVNLWRWDSVIAQVATTTTNGSGQYTFSSLSTADYIVEVRPVDYPVEVYQNKRYQFEGTRIPVVSGGSVTGINIILDPGVEITGTVYDSTTGLPVEFPTVISVPHSGGGGSAIVSGNVDGTYRLVVPEGTYTVYASDSPLGTITFYGNVINQADALTFNAVVGSPVSGIDITLGRLGEILGTVFTSDGTTRVPYQGIGFLPDGASYSLFFCANALGDYRLVSAPIGVKTLVMTSSSFCTDAVADYAPEWWQESPTYDGATPVSLTNDQRFQTDVDFTVESPPGTISGHVYATDGVTPLPGIAIEAHQYFKGQSAVFSYSTTDASGAYQLEGLGTDAYVVRATGLGYNTEYYNNRVSTDTAQLVSVTAGSDTPNIDFTLDLFGTTGTVNGTITLIGRPPKPNPAWNLLMHVTITPVGGGAPIFDQLVMTDQYGAFIAPGVPPGSYHVRGKGINTLANAVNATVALGSNIIDIGELREGDADDSNSVTILDFAILAASFGKTSGMAGYDGRADFNGDNAVTILDFSMLAASFGQTGAP